MSLIQDIIKKSKRKHSYTLMAKRLNRTLNGISKGDYVLVTGITSSGKRAFVDNYYVIGLLKQWKAADPEHRQPLKIVYFSSRYSKDFKILKWTSNRYTTATKHIMDVPTMLAGAGRLFNMNSAHVKSLDKHGTLFEDAMEEGILDIEDDNVSIISIERKMTEVLDEMGDLAYNDLGEATFSPTEEFENSLVVLVVDDLNSVKGDRSSYGTGRMEKDEISASLDKLLLKYTAMGVTVVAIKRSPSPAFGRYLPSMRESNGLSPNKCIVMFNPLQERLNTFVGFEPKDYIDKHNINRLRFAFIAYNETGVSGVALPLLFMPENGIFAELMFAGSDKAEKYNEELFEKHLDIRDNK